MSGEPRLAMIFLPDTDMAMMLTAYVLLVIGVDAASARLRALAQ